MKISEKVLLDNYQAKSPSGENISVVYGKRIFWTYKTSCFRTEASEISLEYNNTETIALDNGCGNHPNVQKIRLDEQELSGDAMEGI